MSLFLTLNLVAWIFCVQTSATSNGIQRELTNDRLELLMKDPKDRPTTLPILLRGPHYTVKFNFTKREINYNLPIYIYSKDKKQMVKVDMPPIQNAAFYEDENYKASISLRCEESDPLSSAQQACRTQKMSGLFFLGGRKHVIEPEKKLSKRFVINYRFDPHTEFSQKHRIFRIFENGSSCNTKIHTDVLKKTFRTTSSKYHSMHEKMNRTKRGKVKHLIETLLVITVKKGLSPEEIHDQTIYFIHTFWMANKIYTYNDFPGIILGMELIGFVLEPIMSSLYVFPNNDKNAKYIMTLETLKALGARRKTLQCDHLSLFTDYQIGKTTDVVGIALPGMMCGKYSSSIMRNKGDFSEIFTFVHEVAHSLNAYHDGIGNTCSASDGYIMAAEIKFRNEQPFMSNHYKFSSCSKRNMTAFLNALGSTSCLLKSYNKPQIAIEIPTGQLFRIQDQCSIRKGTTGICSVPQYKNPKFICLTLWCSLGKYCEPTIPADKTTCGNKKWCMYGSCVSDPKAPLADETCLYGDVDIHRIPFPLPNGTRFHAANCPALIKVLTNSICKIPQYRRICCDTCFQMEHPGNLMVTPKWTTPKPGQSTQKGNSDKHNNQPNSNTVKNKHNVFLIIITTFCLLQIEGI